MNVEIPNESRIGVFVGTFVSTVGRSLLICSGRPPQFEMMKGRLQSPKRAPRWPQEYKVTFFCCFFGC